MTALIQGLVLGFAYVMPIGAQNIFVINTALTQTRRRVFLTAIIIFFFDVMLSVSCFFGIGAFMNMSSWISRLILLVGSFIVMWIGLSIFRSKDTMTDSDESVDMPISKVIFTSFVVTWVNPQAIIDGTMLIGASKASLSHDAGLLFLLGVASASLLWWICLTGAVSLFKTKINDRVLRIINMVCGIIIMAYGVKLLVSFIKIIK